MTTVEQVETAESPPDPANETRARQRAIRAFRPSRSWPAFLAGLVLLVIGVIVAAEIISVLVGGPLRLIPFDRVAALASTIQLSHPAVLTASAVLLLLGLLLLVVALVPGRGNYLPLRTGDPSFTVGLTKGGMRSALVAVAREVDGVDGVRVSIGRRRVRTRVHTYLRAPNGTREAVDGAVRERIAELAPLRPLRAHTRIKLSKA